MFYNFRKNKKAFTLVELIVVVAIIAILGTAVGLAVSGLVDSSRKKTLASNAATLVTAINTYPADEIDQSNTSTEKTLDGYITARAAGLIVKWPNNSSVKTATQNSLKNATGNVFLVNDNSATPKYMIKIRVEKGVASIIVPSGNTDGGVVDYSVNDIKD